MITYKKFLESRSSSILTKIFEHLNDVNHILSVYSDEYDNMVCKIENRMFFYLDRELITMVIDNDDNGILFKSSSRQVMDPPIPYDQFLDALNILEYRESSLSYYLKFKIYEISAIDKIKEELINRYPFLTISPYPFLTISPYRYPDAHSEGEKTLKIRISLDLNKI
jgi:hypothetical protein